MEHVEITTSTEDHSAALCEIRSVNGVVLGRVDFVQLERSGYLWTLHNAAGQWLAEGKVGSQDARRPQARTRAIWEAFVLKR